MGVPGVDETLRWMHEQREFLPPDFAKRWGVNEQTANKLIDGLVSLRLLFRSPYSKKYELTHAGVVEMMRRNPDVAEKFL